MNDFDPIRDNALIGLTLFGLLFGLAVVISACDTKRQLNIDNVLIGLAHLIFGPWAVAFTIWCYDHGDRLDAMPDAYLYDMRMYWIPLAILDAAFLIWYIPQLLRPNPIDTALRMMEQSRQLRADGKHPEADAVFAKAAQIIDKRR